MTLKGQHPTTESRVKWERRSAGQLTRSAKRDSAYRIKNHMWLWSAPVKSHVSVRPSTGEYVRGQASTNGVESFWALLKRGPFARLAWKNASGHEMDAVTYPVDCEGISFV